MLLAESTWKFKTSPLWIFTSQPTRFESKDLISPEMVGSDVEQIEDDVGYEV